MSLVSIVVPIYNVEEYLPRCLDSIVAQTYKDIEIILVDDDSPDNAGAICDEYAAKDERIRVFHIPNGGVGKARQLGVERSTGEYIVFVDPDDRLPLDSVEILYSNMSDEIDIVIGGFNWYVKNKCVKTISALNIDTASKLTKKLLLGKGVTRAPWDKFYRKGCLDNCNFPTAKIGQDLLMNLEISLNTLGKVKVIEDTIYHYFDRASSVVNTHIWTLDYVKFFINTIEDILVKHKSRDKYNDEFYSCALRWLYRAVCYNQKCSLKDPFVKNIYKSVNKEQLNIKGKLKLLLVFNSSLVQRLIYMKNRNLTKSINSDS